MRFFLPVLLFLSNLLNYLDRQLFTALFPVLSPAYRLSDVEMGALGSSFTFSYLLSAPAFGVLLDRISPRRLLAGGVLVFSLGMAICAFAGGKVGLFSGRILTGVGEAALIVVGPRILGGQKGTGKRMALFFLAMPMGVASGFLLASRKISDFHRILFMPVLPGLLLALFFLLPPAGRATPEREGGIESRSDLPVLSRFSMILFDRRLLTLVVLQSVTFFVMGGMGVWISVYLTRVRHLSMASAGQISAVALVTGGVAGILLSGFFCDRIGDRDLEGIFWLLLRTQLLALTGVCLVLLSEGRPMLLFGMLLSSGALFGLNVSLVVAFLRASSPPLWGCVLGGGLFLSHLTGDLPSGALIGLLSAHVGLKSAIEILLPGPLLAGLFAVWITATNERRIRLKSELPLRSG